MKKTNKRGFTIVELVIVVAVIAILAAVLIPTFSSLIKKANLSNDKSFVRNMNTTLAAEGALEKFDSAGDAIDALNRNGFGGKYNTYSTNYHYCYSLENNRMYLLDDNNVVVYPEEEVSVSTLWGLYTDNRTSVTTGVTKYVAMTNITNSDHYNDVFANGTYTIDLNGYFISVDSTVSGVTASNGIVLKGATEGEGANTGYEIVEAKGYGTAESDAYYSALGTMKDGTLTISNKIITENVNIYPTNENIKFDNCIFYGGSVNAADASGYDYKITFNDCQFIDVSGWAVLAHGSVEVIDCTFSNLQTRGAIQVQENSKDITVKISGCTFDGTGGVYPMIRFVGKDLVHCNRPVTNIASLEISNCEFIDLNKSEGIIGFSGEGSCLYNYTGAAGQATVTFSNNKFGDKIEGKYLVGGASGNTLGTLLGASAK